MISINAGKIFTPLETIQNGTILVDEGIISRVGASNRDLLPTVDLLDASKLNVAPGFIDLHTHGAAGCQALDGNVDGLAKMAKFYASHGVTGFLATIGGGLENIEKGIEGVIAYQNSTLAAGGAAILGIHLEGPFINPARRGAFRPESILQVNAALFERLSAMCGKELRMVTVAPELEGAEAFIRAAVSQGVICSAGHSAATWDQMMAAASWGVTHITHTFNAMNPLHHREPGILGAALADERFTAEIIADGVHVHPGVVKLLGKVKGPAGITLITDSVGACGLPDGKYRFEEEEFVLKNGAAMLEDGTLCGSVLTMDRGTANLLAFGAAQTLNEALQMASLTPASVIHYEGCKGQIGKGMHADLTAFDDQFNIHWTMVAGKIVYQSAV